MAKGKDSVIIYESFLEATEDLEAIAIAEIWRAIRSFIKGEEPKFSDVSAKLAWKFIRLQLEADAQKWSKTCEARASAGRNGGIKSGQSRGVAKQVQANESNGSFASNGEAKSSKTKQSQANEADTDTETDTDKEKNITKKEIEQKRLESAERIWQAYPKKDGKQEGIKAILKCLQAGKSEAYLLDRVKAYCVQCEGKEKGYIKNAQGWFNNARYEDASLDNPAPPAESGELSLEAFRLAYRKCWEQDFAVDHCCDMSHHKAVLAADYATLRTDFRTDYEDIKARYNAPFSNLKKYVSKVLARGRERGQQ